MSSFGSMTLPNRPNLPYLNSALVQIGNELDRQATRASSGTFAPFGPLEGFIFTDPNGEMIKSLRVPTKSAGILRFGRERAPRLSDLPNLTPSASKAYGRPTKAKPVNFTISPEAVGITEVDGGTSHDIKCDQLQNVRIDSAGRFFFLVAEGSGAPLCLKATPWIAPALALLMAAAARTGSLRDLESEIAQRVRSR